VGQADAPAYQAAKAGVAMLTRNAAIAYGTKGIRINAASPNAYRIRPVNALNGFVSFDATNPRPAAAPAVGGTVKVVGMNLLNFFNTFANCLNGVGGAPTDCRGAASQAEFDRQYPKTVAAILALNPDVLGVNELENDGYGPTSALQFLVDRLNAATAPGTYAFIDADARTGQLNALGTDAIRIALIYKPAVVTPADGAALTREDVQRHCARRLDAHQIPKIVTVRDRLPTTLTGKVSRRSLRQTAIAEGWSS